MFPQRFAGKNMIITGGSTGIGFATALRAAKEGANVIIGSRDAEKGNAAVAKITAEGGKAIYVQTDVSNSADVKNLFAKAEAKFGEINVVISNAGTLNDSATLLETTDDEWDRVMKINTYGMFYVDREAFSYMKKTGKGGSIVNLGSIAGITGMPSGSVYCASKHGVNGLTKSVAMDGRFYGIRCNSVNPAGTDTPLTEANGNAMKMKIYAMQQEEKDFKPFLKECMGSMKTVLPMGRNNTAEEQASVILFIASDECTMTGAVVASDGGWTAY